MCLFTFSSWQKVSINFEMRFRNPITSYIINFMSNYYAEMLIALSIAKVNFIVAGGVACVLHGVERVTMDLDLAVEMTDENLARFVEVAEKLNLKPRVPVPLQFLSDERNRRQMVEEKNALVFSVVDPQIPMKHIDIFLTAENSYGSLMEDCDIIKLGTHDIRIASKDRIIEMKLRVLPPRPKDTFDIAELQKLKAEQNDKNK